MSEVLLDRAGRRRSPATMPGFHAGRPPRNKGLRYPAAPPRVEEIVAVTRAAGAGPHGQRLRGLIVVLWRTGLRIQEALSLGEQQYGQFLTRLKVLQDTRRRNQQEHARLINELQRLTNVRRQGGTASEAELKPRLSALQELQSRSAAEMRKAYDAIDEVLDVHQQARFRVFEEQIERRKLELIVRARQQNPNRPLAPRRPPQF